MIFTVGHAISYLKGLATYAEFFKLGKYERDDDSYEGGYAFQTFESAADFIDAEYPHNGYSVFGLLADWEKDTEPSRDGNYHVLLKDAQIVAVNYADLHNS